MVDSTKKSLDTINKISRQILSRILEINTISQATLQDLENTEVHPSNKEITELMSKRELLITRLFKQHKAQEISAQPELVQEMLDLDNKLTTKSELCKQGIYDQAIKLKKSKKVAKSYQQY
ncbi:hypothetical protein H4J57_00850 [Colwellia sp. BRX8-7]|jgi:hypothetical protein|uniref:hypothetical protein n=1 Tax=Colwellia sp. BRX8-7 TaxID=2759833 RepID=UPI0015F6618E|nr:hypothetical protein [Colwellia sp. BRX8-7]MBA6335748.1 hypothetical protein [Colwellia sp. BRX8-7]